MSSEPKIKKVTLTNEQAEKVTGGTMEQKWKVTEVNQQEKPEEDFRYYTIDSTNSDGKPEVR